jgi:histidyl-tRNA synthetase
MKENHLWEKLSVKKSVLVTIFSPGLEAESISLSQTLRQKGINVELYLDSSARLEKQFKYADRKKIDWVVVIGPNEAKKGKVILKNLENRSQELLSKKELIRILKNNS